LDALGKAGLPAARRSGFNAASRARFARLGEFLEMPRRTFLAGFANSGRVVRSHAGTGGTIAFFTQPRGVFARRAIQDRRLDMSSLASIVQLFSQRRHAALRPTP
jgi:hypothetical protein